MIERTFWNINKSIAFWVLTIAIILLGMYLVKYVEGESYQCMNNPYTYSIKLLEKANDAEVTCTCSTMKKNSMSVLLTREGFSVIQPPKINYTTKFNFTTFRVKE